MEQHGFTNGESNAAWDKKTLKKDHEYSVTFQFIYFEELNEILYIAFYDGKDSTAGTDALQTQESRAENATNRVLTRYLMGAIETAQDSQPRNVYDEFHDVISDTNYYTQINDINSSDAQRAEKAISKVLSIVTNIAMVVSVIILAVIGVKYMIGSAEERAEYKKDMIPYLVGAVLIFGISIIVKILYNFGNQIKAI